jgi:2-polyprenyl-6-methoxyphenol hydroxylase-like FAD-dependent oxidoreductase
MRLRRVSVLGGGPGGLYAARLLRLAYPECKVIVHEQGEPGTTFGFGVGVSAGTQRKLDDADPDTLRDILAAGFRHDMTMEVDGTSVWVRNDKLIGIARTTLLAVLQRHAEKAGVQLRFGARRTADELDADLVIAADGVSSATRETGRFGARIEEGQGRYLWCAAPFALADGVFAPVRTEHGTFVTHAYPYAHDASTFLIETDEHTWRRAGFDRSGEVTPLEGSDETSLRYLGQAFGTQLRGHPLIGNRTRWQRFRTVRCDRWSCERVVLLGDAAHTAHYSIGSGTKLAMEDAISLVKALQDEPDLQTAFHRYESERRPPVERLQELARRSQLWWESFPSRLHLPVERLMVAFMSRAGNVPLHRFAATSPDVVAAALRQYAGGASVGDQSQPGVPDEITNWVLDQPLDHERHHFSHRIAPGALTGLVAVDDAPLDPWSEAGDAVVARARRARESGALGFRFTGPQDRFSTLTRMDLAERVRTEIGGLVVVDGPPGLRDDLAAGLVSARADLVTLIDGDREQETA